MGENMKNTPNYRAGIAAFILVCVIFTGTVSAYDADTACQSANEIISSTNNTTALELVGFYSDYSLRQFKIWTEFFIDPDLCVQIRQYIEELDPGQELSELVLTTVSGDERVSYKLSPETSLFVKMSEPVDFPDSQKYTDKMMLYFKIIGYHGKDTPPKNASSLDPRSMFGNYNGVTPAGLLEDLSGKQATKISASSLLTTATLNSASREGVGGVRIAQINTGITNTVATVTDRLPVQAGKSDFASLGSDLIGNHRQR
jgi:hypothetical protein